MLNKYSEQILETDEIIKVLYSNPKIDLDKINTASITEVDLFNKALQELYLDDAILSKYIEPSLTLGEYDSLLQQKWHMPQSYKDMDIAAYILDLCDDNEAVLQRVGYELLEFQKLNFFDALRFFKYLIDTMRKNNIVWGVGRGSSVSSHVLFLLGIHKIDSLKYQLEFKDFIKG